MASREPSSASDAPQPGLYKCRLVRGGPFAAVRLAVFGMTDDTGALVEDEQLRCWIDGCEVPLSHAPWPYCGRYPIDQAEYYFMIADSKHAATHRPTDPKASPRRAVDWYEDFRT